MFTPGVFIGILVINIISLTVCNVQYTEEDFKVIRGIINSMNINYLVFVTDTENLGLINFLKENLYSVVISPEQLNKVLNDEMLREEFFPTATMIVSKENLNFTIIFQKLSEKHLPACVVFANSLETLHHSYIPINTDFFIVQYAQDTTILNKGYHVKPGLNITLIPTGIWKREDINAITVNRTRTYDFDGATLGMLHFMEDQCENLFSILMLDRIDCFHQEVLRILSDKLNYRIRRVNCTERVFPYNFPNGTLSELFLMLASPEVDFSSGSYIINIDRLSRYDFAWPTFTSRSMLYIKERKQSVWRGYLRPIHKHLWYAVCVWIMGIGLFNQIFQECLGNTFKPRLSLIPDLIKSIFTSLQVFCGQGLGEIPKLSSVRTLFITSFFLYVVFDQVYSGFLISYLMIDVPNIPFTDINGFLLNGKYKLLSLNSGFHNYLSSKVLYDNNKDESIFKVPPDQLPDRADKAIEILCNNKRLTYVEFRENIVMHEIPCKIIELPHPILYQSIGIGFRKHSPYREPIQRGIVSLNTAGILQRMRQQLFSYVHLKEKEISDEEYVKVSFKHVVSAFFILISGMIFAWAFFIIEHLFVLSVKLYWKVRNRKAKPELKKKN